MALSAVTLTASPSRNRCNRVAVEWSTGNTKICSPFCRRARPTPSTWRSPLNITSPASIGVYSLCSAISAMFDRFWFLSSMYLCAAEPGGSSPVKRSRRRLSRSGSSNSIFSLAAAAVLTTCSLNPRPPLTVRFLPKRSTAMRKAASKASWLAPLRHFE